MSVQTDGHRKVGGMLHELIAKIRIIIARAGIRRADRRAANGCLRSALVTGSGSWLGGIGPQSGAIPIWHANES